MKKSLRRLEEYLEKFGGSQERIATEDTEIPNCGSRRKSLCALWLTGLLQICSSPLAGEVRRGVTTPKYPAFPSETPHPTSPSRGEESDKQMPGGAGSDRSNVNNVRMERAKLKEVQIMKRVLFMLVAAALMFGSAVREAAAVGSTPNDTVITGFFTNGDTIPKSLGQVSLGYTSTNLPADTQYKGCTATITRSVDTAWDLSAIDTPADVNNAKARDTVSYAYRITNNGNATQTMDLSAIFVSIGSDTNWGANAYRIFSDNNNNGVWENGDTVVDSVTLSANSSDTVVVVVLVPVTAVEDDSSGTRLFMTDRAPIVSPSTTGDLWQNGAPISGNDAYDTQYDTVVTRVVGPNVRVSKAQTLQSGRARPGDTIVYAITFDNDGSDSAANVVIYDAISGNSTFVPNSADSAELSSNSYLTAYDSSNLGTATFDDTGSTLVKVIRWTLTQPLGVTSGDNKATVNFTGLNDAGRVYFKARIN